MWPSSRLLAHAIALQTNGLADYQLPSIENCNVLEVGAGCGLGGLVAAKCGAAKVCLTEKIDLIDLLEQEVEVNKLQATVSVRELDWLHESIEQFDFQADVVIAADVIYDQTLFQPLLSVLTKVLKPFKALIVAYKERSPQDRAFLEGPICAAFPGMRLVSNFEMEDEGCEFWVWQAGAS